MTDTKPKKRSKKPAIPVDQQVAQAVAAAVEQDSDHAALQSLERRFIALLADVRSAQWALRKATDAEAQAAADAQQLRTQLREATRDLRQLPVLTRERDTAAAAAVQLQADLHALQADLQAAQAERDAAQLAAAQAQLGASTLQVQLTGAATELASVRADLSAARAQLAAAVQAEAAANRRAAAAHQALDRAATAPPQATRAPVVGPMDEPEAAIFWLRQTRRGAEAARAMRVERLHRPDAGPLLAAVYVARRTPEGAQRGRAVERCLELLAALREVP